MRSIHSRVFLIINLIVFAPLLIKSQILGSKILATQQQANSFMNLVGLPLNASMINVYRASRDGFTTSAFISAVNGINGTYTIIKSTKGYIFGGFTNVNWGLNIGWASDRTAFIFSLTNPQNYPCIIYQNVKSVRINNTIYTTNITGTTGFFMGAGPDLFLVNNANQYYSKGQIVDFVLPSNYSSTDGYLFLTGSADFLSAEIEVYSCKILIFNFRISIFITKSIISK